MQEQIAACNELLLVCSDKIAESQSENDQNHQAVLTRIASISETCGEISGSVEVNRAEAEKSIQVLCPIDPGICRSICLSLSERPHAIRSTDVPYGATRSSRERSKRPGEQSQRICLHSRFHISHIIVWQACFGSREPRSMQEAHRSDCGGQTGINSSLPVHPLGWIRY